MSDAWFIVAAACSVLGLLTLFFMWATKDERPPVRTSKRGRWEC